MQRDQLFLRGGIKEEQVLQYFFVGAEVAVHAVFQLAAEGFIEALVFFPVILQAGFQFALNFRLDVFGDQLQLAVMLQQFAGNVERQVFGINQTFDEAKIIRQQIGAFVHDQDAVCIQLQPFFIFLGIKVVGRVFGYEQNGVVADRAVYADVQVTDWLIVAVALFGVEVFVVFGL